MVISNSNLVEQYKYVLTCAITDVVHYHCGQQMRKDNDEYLILLFSLISNKLIIIRKIVQMCTYLNLSLSFYAQFILKYYLNYG